MKKVVGLMLGLVPVSAFAECVPVPDCASIGYTATSCDGDSIKCPFDTSKLRCLPCDSSFRFACDGENIKEAVGEACNNKYAACSCIDGANFINGECICDTSCKVGNIYYSDGTCSSCILTNKTAIGIVIKDNSLIASINVAYQTWSPADDNIEALPDLTENDQAKDDFNGKNNTLEIVKYYGEDADETKIAALYCYNYSTEGTAAKSWYLPAGGELYSYLYPNYATIKTIWTKLGITLTKYDLWSSTEMNYFYTFVMNNNGSFIGRPKYYWNLSVVCFREI